MAGQLSGELGLPYAAAEAGQRIVGRYQRRFDLVSGRFALIANSREFTLVPWRPAMESGLGRQISGHLRGETFTRSEEHTSELQSLMRISYAVFCLKKKKKTKTQQHRSQTRQ